MSRIPLVMSGKDGQDCLLGRFNDPVDARQLAPPLALALRCVDEVIAEEQTAEEDTSTERYRRKQQRRRVRGKHSKLVLDVPVAVDSATTPSNLTGAASGGTRANPSDATRTVPMRFEGVVASSGLGESSSLAADVPRHVVLQMSADRSLIHVVPVDEWYNFRKPSVVADKFLSEIDVDFEARTSMLKEKHARFKRIYNVIQRVDEANKPATSNSLSAATGVEEEGSAMFFGRGANSKKGSRRASKSLAKKFSSALLMGGEDEDVKEWGVDVDGGEEEMARVSDVSDDEEAHVQEAQAKMEYDNDLEVGKVIGSDDGSVADEEEEEEEEEEGGGVNQVSNAKLAGEFAAAEDFKVHQRKKELQIQDDAKQVDQTSGVRAAVSVAPKRKRGDEASSEDDAAKRGKDDAAADSGGGGDGLREDEIKQYIAAVGGKIALKELAGHFKAKIKALGETGKKRFVDIVNRVTVNVVDANHGKLLALKH